MSSRENKELKKLLSSMHMGSSIFRVYVEKAQSDDFKVHLIKIVKTIENQELKIMEIVKKSGNSISDRMSLWQEMAINMQIIKTPKNDFKIAIESLRGLNMGLVSTLNYIHDHQNADDELLDYLKKIIKEYDALTDKLKAYTLEHFS